MNRRARRIQALEEKRLDWVKVLPKGTYAELGACDGRILLMKVFRLISSEISHDTFEDEVLFNSTMTLIKHGLLDVWFALDRNHVRVRFKLTQLPGGAA